MLPTKVKLNRDHRYFDDEGKEHIGFTKLYETFLVDPFNAEMAAYGTAKSKGISVKEVLARWEAQRQEGCRIDDALDLYCKTKTHLPADEDIIDGIKEVYKTYEVYHKTLGQQVVYSEQYRVAGTIDRISFISNRKDCAFVSSDFKCFEKEISMMPTGSPRFLKAPFDHLANTKYTRTAFQLSLYSFMAQEMTGRVPIRQFIHWIDPRTMKRNEQGDLNVKHQLIDAMYLRNDVILLLETYKEQILELTESKTMEAW